MIPLPPPSSIVILTIWILIASTGFVWRYFDWTVQYVAVADCGSSSTKLSLFRFHCVSRDKSSCVLGDMAYHSVRVSLADGGSAMRDALSVLKTFMQQRVRGSPVLGAVVGTQIFRERATPAILNDAQLFLFGGGHKKGVTAKTVTVLSGVDEAYYLLRSVQVWLSLNGRLADSQASVVADLGSRSLQVATKFNRNKKKKKKLPADVVMMGDQLVYVKSFSQGGMQQKTLDEKERKGLKKMLEKKKGKWKLFLTGGFAHVNLRTCAKLGVDAQTDDCKYVKELLKDLFKKEKSDDAMEVLKPEISWTLGFAVDRLLKA